MTEKLYLSVDIEGVAGVAAFTEVDMAHPFEYGPFRDQMAAEAEAACAGAFAAGVDAVVVKDAHHTGRNIPPHRLIAPTGKSLELIRGWSGHPLGMVQEIDTSFGALAFVGFHAAAGSSGNPLAHTISSRMFARVELNGERASEMLIFGWAAAELGVPLVFVSGDECLCQDAVRLFPGVQTVATLRGIGASVQAIAPVEAVRRIEAGVRDAMTGSRPHAVSLPDRFHLKLSFLKPFEAYAKSFYPGARSVSETDVVFESSRYMDVLTFLNFAFR